MLYCLIVLDLGSNYSIFGRLWASNILGTTATTEFDAIDAEGQQCLDYRLLQVCYLIHT